ncbi:LUD domain-containing protein [Halomicrobium urmianum]|uniref:LUD domain-containing protein n=1 Tax=Halomicrobium urmianum TaxID=1586233 RepID=UPI001CD98D40|nr:LUD domain-containing protein [Halomicrobium urmianum]
MSATPIDSLASALSALDVPCERTTPDEFGETLAEHLRGPAVGVSLDGVDASLSRTDVTVDPTPAELDAAHTGVTPASFAIADYGSVVIPTTETGTELVSLFVDRHVAVVDEADVVPGMEAAFDRFGDEFRADAGSGIVATGPSATADMGALVRGAHGPSEVRVIVLEDDDE